MPDFISIGSLLWTTAILAIVVVGGSIVFIRKAPGKRLILLSLLACGAALVFAPLLRSLPEQFSIVLMLVGLWPTLAIITASVAASMLRFMQTRSRESLFSLLLSVLAVALFYINTTTSWLWPYRPY